jgi:hypothetical protein
LGQWGEIFGDTIIATAILDRLLHNCTVVNRKWESYLLKEKQRARLLCKIQDMALIGGDITSLAPAQFHMGEELLPPNICTSGICPKFDRFRYIFKHMMISLLQHTSP